MRKNKALVFDMDGTIANLYGVEGWLTDLRAENERPYAEAKPLCDMVVVNTLLDILKRMYGYKVIVTSWSAKDSTPDFMARVDKTKREWIERYEFPADEINIVAYGTPKQNVTRNRTFTEQILFDDSADVRKDWDLGRTVDANGDIVEFLAELVEKEMMNVG